MLIKKKTSKAEKGGREKGNDASQRLPAATILTSGRRGRKRPKGQPGQGKKHEKGKKQEPGA